LHPPEVRHGQHVGALRGILGGQAELLEDLGHRLAQGRFGDVNLVFLGNLEALENHGSLLTGKDSQPAPVTAVHPSRFPLGTRRHRPAVVAQWYTARSPDATRPVAGPLEVLDQSESTMRTEESRA